MLLLVPAPKGAPGTPKTRLSAHTPSEGAETGRAPDKITDPPTELMLRSDFVIFVDFVDCVDSVDTDWLLLLPLLLPLPLLSPRGSRPRAEALSSSMRSDDTGCIGEHEAGADLDRDDVLSEM